jgi:hypothetical protein
MATTTTYTISISTSTTTYTSGDVVGTIQALTDVVPGAGGFSIESAMVVDSSARSDSLELWIFTSAISAAADNVAHSISDADAAKCVGIIPITTYYASALNTVGILRSVGLRIGAGNDIWVLAVVRAAAVYTNGLTVLLSITSG